MQDLGLGLTVRMVCRTAYRLAEHEGRQNFSGRNDTQVAGKWWWTEFKKLYNLSLFSENLAAYGAAIANPEIIEDLKKKKTRFLELLSQQLNECFQKAGIYPINRMVKAKEAVAPSALTAAPLAAPEAEARGS
ncbi:hypothetical protein HHI36_006539, partial [Cryptolaemus montrouzieri]